VISALDTKI
jgi:hypothetical protein